MTPQQKQTLAKIDELTERAKQNPGTLYKISNGFYVFCGVASGAVVDVINYYPDGMGEWQLKDRVDNNWMGSYRSLKSIIAANELKRG